MNITDVFLELAAPPRWVPFIKAWNPKREAYDKIPHNGARKLSTKEPRDWLPLIEALEVAKVHGLSGVGFVMTGGVIQGDWQLVGFDFDDVTGPIELLARMDSYIEISPSGRGIRAFVWVPASWAKRFKDSTKILLPNCGHAEIYLGSSPRFLTVTFQGWGGRTPIAELDETVLTPLEKLLQPADSPTAEVTELPICDNGTPIAMTDLSPDQQHLINGTGAINRSNILLGLLIKLIDSGHKQEDVFATLTQTPALWLYLLDHRNNNPEKAMQFANEELARAFKKSTAGKLAALFANPFWKVVEAAEEVKDPDAPPERDDYYMPTISEWMTMPKTARFAVGKQFLKGAINIMYGDSGHGKTTLLAGLAVCKAQAVLDPEFKWMGMDIYDPRPQRIIAGEDAVGVTNMVLGFCKLLGIDPEVLPLRISTCAYDFSLADEVTKIKAGIKADIEKYGISPDFTVDTLSCNSGTLEENSATDMRVLLNRLDELRGDATVNVAHHNGLEHSDRERGSSVIRKNPTSNNHCQAENGIFTYTCKKQRGAKIPPPLTMRFEEVVIGKDYDNQGNEIGDLTTAVLVLAGEDCRQLRIKQFYARFPKLGGDERTKARRAYMETLLLNIYGLPGTKQVDLAQACDVAEPTITKVIKQLREYKLIEPEDPLKLTQLGIKGLAELGGDLKVKFAAQGLEVQIPVVVPKAAPGVKRVKKLKAESAG